MEYEDRGAGMPLLLIHGFPLNRTLWKPQWEALGGVARLLVPDLRGFGESDAAPGPYSMDLLARDCAGLLDVLGITQPVVVGGLSMGGYVTFAFARSFPERVRGLILAATRAGADTPEGKANREKSAALARAQGPAAVAGAMLPRMMSPKTYETRQPLVELARRIMETASVEGIVGAQLGMKDRPDFTSLLSTIEKPVLILHGADDSLIPVAEAEAMQHAMRSSRLVIVPEAGHLLNLEQPGIFNRAVMEFLASLG
jgi:pimeloyl-ACP methyl ester carboxylesterase